MQTFFSSIQAIEYFTHALKKQSDNACRHCFKSDHWISQGYIYKRRCHKNPVGKRILCANRYGKQGCGRTRALYLNHILPARCYDAAQLMVFIHALLAGASISKAYYSLSYKNDARQAWRWVNCLTVKLGLFRQFIHRPLHTNTSMCYRSRSRRLQILLPTLQRLLEQGDIGEHFQHAYQTLFL